MSYGTPYGAAAYAGIGLQTKVATASPHGLIVMLYDGALQALANASHHLDEGNVALKAKSLAKAVDIINKGLNASLDPEVGGEIATSLKSLYDYMCRRLTLANLNNDRAIIEEITGLLRQLRGAWAEIAVRVQRDAASPRGTLEARV
jgi:flagellar protein FliS